MRRVTVFLFLRMTQCIVILTENPRLWYVTTRHTHRGDSRPGNVQSPDYSSSRVKIRPTKEDLQTLYRKTTSYWKQPGIRPFCCKAEGLTSLQYVTYKWLLTQALSFLSNFNLQPETVSRINTNCICRTVIKELQTVLWDQSKPDSGMKIGNSSHSSAFLQCD